MASNADIRLPGELEPRATSNLLSFDFGNSSAIKTLLGTSHLSGPLAENWLVGGEIEAVSSGTFSGIRNDRYQFLHCQSELASSDIRQITRELYRELIEHIGTSRYSQPVRFWNYVPSINLLSDPAIEDSEVYRQFCWGRAEALETANLPLPAATAVGCSDGKLHISLLSATQDIAVSHFENPRQTSAYHYPRQYGPRSPSFARATVIQSDDASMLLLSGTASIVQHETRHPGNLEAQMQETASNIDSLLDSVLNKTDGQSKPFTPVSSRCYLRHAEDLPRARIAFSEALADWPEPAFLVNDICRRELVMEVEAVFRGD